RKAKLAERDRLEEGLPGLLQRERYVQAFQAMERVATLEKEALGETHPEVIGSLQRLAGWREAREEFAEAVRVRAEGLRLQRKRLGNEHWQVTDAGLALQHAGPERDDR